MLENLTDRLSRVVKTMRGQARLTEANTAEMLQTPPITKNEFDRETKRALLQRNRKLQLLFGENLNESLIIKNLINYLFIKYFMLLKIYKRII